MNFPLEHQNIPSPFFILEEENGQDPAPLFAMDQKKEMQSPYLKISDGLRKTRTISNEDVSELYKDYYNQWILQNVGK